VTGHTIVAQRPVAKDATREELLEAYNQMARGTKTLNATVELKPTAGSKYSGVIDEYHEVKAFLLAARPAQIRVIGRRQSSELRCSTWPATARCFEFRFLEEKNSSLVRGCRTRQQQTDREFAAAPPFGRAALA